jgi:hypothetical protein
MQRADPTLLVLIDEIVSAADLDRSKDQISQIAHLGLK